MNAPETSDTAAGLCSQLAWRTLAQAPTTACVQPGIFCTGGGMLVVSRASVTSLAYLARCLLRVEKKATSEGVGPVTKETRWARRAKAESKHLTDSTIKSFSGKGQLQTDGRGRKGADSDLLVICDVPEAVGERHPRGNLERHPRHFQVDPAAVVGPGLDGGQRADGLGAGLAGQAAGPAGEACPVQVQDGGEPLVGEGGEEGALAGRPEM